MLLRSSRDPLWGLVSVSDKGAQQMPLLQLDEDCGGSLFVVTLADKSAALNWCHASRRIAYRLALERIRHQAVGLRGHFSYLGGVLLTAGWQVILKLREEFL